MLTGKDVKLLQKKPELLPEWNSCIDTHLYEGRVLKIILRNRPNFEIGQVMFTTQSLADRSKDGEIASVWVGVINFQISNVFIMSHSSSSMQSMLNICSI